MKHEAGACASRWQRPSPPPEPAAPRPLPFVLHLVHVIGDFQETLFGVVQVLVLEQELGKQKPQGVRSGAAPSLPPPALRLLSPGCGQPPSTAPGT
jgi:hypothetical protein